MKVYKVNLITKESYHAEKLIAANNIIEAIEIAEENCNLENSKYTFETWNVIELKNLESHAIIPEIIL